MTISIEVLPLSDSRPISFSDLELFHIGCTPGTMQIHTNPATNVYSLSCNCGLNIELTNNGTAEKVIIRTAIDNNSRELLPADSFLSHMADEVAIEPRVRRNS